MSMGARPPTKMAARVTLIGATGFLAVTGAQLAKLDRRKETGRFSCYRLHPVDTAGDQQHRVATALYEDLAQIVAMVHVDGAQSCGPRRPAYFRHLDRSLRRRGSA